MFLCGNTTAGPWIEYAVAIHDREHDLWDVEGGPDGWAVYDNRLDAAQRVEYLTSVGFPAADLKIVHRITSQWTQDS